MTMGIQGLGSGTGVTSLGVGGDSNGANGTSPILQILQLLMQILQQFSQSPGGQMSGSGSCGCSGQSYEGGTGSRAGDLFNSLGGLLNGVANSAGDPSDTGTDSTNSAINTAACDPTGGGAAGTQLAGTPFIDDTPGGTPNILPPTGEVPQTNGTGPVPVDGIGPQTGGPGPLPTDGGTDGPITMTGPSVSLAQLPEGLQPAGNTGLADNVGNSVSVTFDGNGQISAINTGRTQVESTDAEGNVTSFSGARFNFDGRGNLQSASSSIAQGQIPTQPEPSGETIEFVADQPQRPVSDNNGQLIGFADAGFENNNGRAVRITRDTNGDINGFEIEERTTLPAGSSPFGGNQPFVDINVRIYNLQGDLIAQAVT